MKKTTNEGQGMPFPFCMPQLRPSSRNTSTGSDRLTPMASPEARCPDTWKRSMPQSSFFRCWKELFWLSGFWISGTDLWRVFARFATPCHVCAAADEQRAIDVGRPLGASTARTAEHLPLPARSRLAAQQIKAPRSVVRSRVDRGHKHRVSQIIFLPESISGCF